MSTRESTFHQWVKKAANDLRSAEVLLGLDNPLAENACTLCQQAAEKYLKAALFILGIDFKRSHSMGYLLGLLEQRFVIPVELFDLADFLTPFAVALRYPGDLEVDEGDGREALLAATTIRDFVFTVIDAQYFDEGNDSHRL